MQPDNRDGMSGNFNSPAGYAFGIQGWTWGQEQVKSITFMFNGTCEVRDQHGRLIKGTVVDGKTAVYFNKASHREVIDALTAERIDWTKLSVAGWPQLTYDELKKLPEHVLPPLPDNVEDFPMYLGNVGRHIKDVAIRRGITRLYQERMDARCSVEANEEASA